MLEGVRPPIHQRLRRAHVSFTCTQLDFCAFTAFLESLPGCSVHSSPQSVQVLGVGRWELAQSPLRASVSPSCPLSALGAETQPRGGDVAVHLGQVAKRSPQAASGPAKASAPHSSRPQPREAAPSPRPLRMLRTRAPRRRGRYFDAPARLLGPASGRCRRNGIVAQCRWVAATCGRAGPVIWPQRSGPGSLPEGTERASGRRPPPPPPPPGMSAEASGRAAAQGLSLEVPKPSGLEPGPAAYGLKPLTPNSKYVKLNVGGSLHYTTLRTLTGQDSVLKAMFSGRAEVITDAGGTRAAPTHAALHAPERRRPDPPVFIAQGVCALVSLPCRQLILTSSPRFPSNLPFLIHNRLSPPILTPSNNQHLTEPSPLPQPLW